MTQNPKQKFSLTLLFFSLLRQLLYLKILYKHNIFTVDYQDTLQHIHTVRTHRSTFFKTNDRFKVDPTFRQLGWYFEEQAFTLNNFLTSGLYSSAQELSKHTKIIKLRSYKRKLSPLPRERLFKRIAS